VHQNVISGIDPKMVSNLGRNADGRVLISAKLIMWKVKGGTCRKRKVADLRIIERKMRTGTGRESRAISEWQA
jgi:hypothetical protein